VNIEEYSPTFLHDQGYKEVKKDLWLKELDNIDDENKVECPFCGRENNPNNRNCDNCGWILSDD